MRFDDFFDSADVSTLDDLVRRESSGEVLQAETLDTAGEAVPGGLFCPSIFANDQWGHLELGTPVLHPTGGLRSRRPWTLASRSSLTGKKNRSAVSGLISGAKAEMEKKRQGGASSHPDKVERTGCTLYMSRKSFERLQTWAAYLDGVAQYELVERAIEQYCDKLADTYLEGEDPSPPRDKRMPLP